MTRNLCICTEVTKKGRRSRAVPFSLSRNHLYGVRGSFTQGELEGAKPASNRIKCRAKPCLARRAWSEAAIFAPQGGTKITTLFQAVEKSRSLFRQPEGRHAFACLPFSYAYRPVMAVMTSNSSAFSVLVMARPSSMSTLTICSPVVQTMRFVSPSASSRTAS